MKTAKRLFTLAICLTLLMSFAFIAPISAYKQVEATSTNVGAVLTIQNLPKEGEVGQTLTIPKGSATSGAVSVTIKDPRNREIKEGTTLVGNYDNSGSVISFVPRQIGYYTVEYKVEGDITRSQVYSIYVSGTEPKIYVSGTEPTISSTENQEVYLPEKIYDAKEVELPLPVVTNNEGEEVENLQLLIKDGENAETNSSANPVVWVSAIDPNYDVVNLERRDGKVYFNAVKDTSNNYIYGTYTVVYTYADAVSGLSTTKYVPILVERNYKENVVDKVDMTFVWENGKSLPTSGVLGQDLVLPKPIAQDKNQSSAEIQSYTTVKINFVPEGNLDDKDAWVSYTFDNDKFSFVPMNKTENGGYYLVEYTITDYFGHKIEKTYTIKNVSDSVKPEVYLVNSYDLDDAMDGSLDLTDMTYVLPSKIIVSSEQDIVIPAIYATDNYIKDFSKLTLSRYIDSYRLDTKTGDVWNTNQAITLNSSNADLNASIRNMLTRAGTYTIKYQASDGVNTKTVSFELVVLESFVDETAPRITFELNEKAVFAGEEFTFKAPTVADYHSDSLAEVEIDTQNCKVEVGYYFGTDYASFKADFASGKAIADCADNAHFALISELEDQKGYYSFEVPAEITADQIVVLVRAFDRAKFGGVNSEDTAVDNVATKEVQIRVIKKDAELPAPAFNLDQILADIEQIDQNAKYEIVSANENKDFVFTGENLDFAVASVNVYDPNGKEVSVRGTSTLVNADNTKLYIEGAYFTTTRDGEYVITFTVTDYNGTSTIVAYTVDVKDTIPPMLEIGEVPSTVTVGEAVVLPDCKMIDNGQEEQNMADVSIDFRNQDNPRYQFVSATNKFTALEEGTFTFVYRVSDGVNPAVEKTMTITAVAGTSANNLSLSQSNWVSEARLKAILSDGVETGKYTLVGIPYLDAVDAVNGIKNYTVKVKSPNGGDLSVKLIEDIEDETEIINGIDRNRLYGAFEPVSKDGKYTITYVVEDNAGNSYTLEKTLVVGDKVKPELTIANEDKNLPTTIDLGSTLDIDYEDFTFNDNTTKNEYDFTFTVSVKGDSGETTLEKKDGHYTYEFTEAGTYTLTYVLKDKAGNTTEKTTEIKVVAESGEDNNVTTVVAGVLIAVFVVLCSGIVVYFVVVNKRAKQKVEQPVVNKVQE